MALEHGQRKLFCAWLSNSKRSPCPPTGCALNHNALPHVRRTYVDYIKWRRDKAAAAAAGGGGAAASAADGSGDALPASETGLWRRLCGVMGGSNVLMWLLPAPPHAAANGDVAKKAC